jgi:hypothetical protein
MSNGFYTTLSDRAVLKVEGADAPGFLQGLITNDVDKISDTRAVYAALLTPQGKILFDFFVSAQGNAYLVDCASAQAGELRKRLTFYRLRAAVEITDVSGEYDVGAAWGDGSNFGLGSEPGSAVALGGGVVFVDPRSAAAGLRAVVAKGALAETAATYSLEAATAEDYHAHRISLGLADSTVDIGSGELFPHESNLDQLNGVDFKKGCYVGQEVVSRTEHRSTARKRIVPVTVEGGAATAGATINAGEKSIGTLMSVDKGSAIALIRLDRAQSALDASIAIEADGHALTLHQPEWAGFDVPGAGQ